MTTALPAQDVTPSGSPLTDAPRLRLVGDTTRAGGEVRGSSPLVAYLVLVPEGTDPADLFAEDVQPPEIRALGTPTDPRPVRETASDGIRIDHARHVAELDGRELDLTYLEFGLLAHLVEHPHQTHTREQLMVGIWGYDHIGDGRTVDVHVARLRRKLGAAHRQRIVTVRRVGYKYVPDQQHDARSTHCR
ncbi:winged helix-turn-helix domain-containing protein [Streptomyces sp. IBSBF 3136]|uniref:winged helix-turn-helix domain-containing protein n=1 Tax=Streptomyces sp. IBSBF 3136 TaxID=2903524 RepID=UPI002FDC13FD